MKIYVSYITKNILISILIVLSILAAIIWLTQSIRYLTLISNSGINFLSFVNLSLLLIPSYIQILFPVATFIGIVIYYHKLYIDRELIILKNSGLSNFLVYKPAVLVAILMMIINYLFSFFIMPYCSKYFREKITDFKENYIHLLIEEGVFNNKIKNLTIYVEKHLPNNLFKNIIIYDQRDLNKGITVIAEYGSLTKTNNSLEFRFLNGNRQEIDKNKKISILHFDSLTYSINFEGQYKKDNSFEPNELYIFELLNSYNKTYSNKIFLELNQRFSWSLYNIILGFLAINIFEFSYSRKSFIGKTASIAVTALIIIISYFLVSNFTLYNKIFILLIYIKIIMLILSQIYILFYKQDG